uniref:Uncharacterized protein n=1 Tax=Mustela putorius furo TaxID=9669 RepID=M3XN57_MUSPF
PWSRLDVPADLGAGPLARTLRRLCRRRNRPALARGRAEPRARVRARSFGSLSAFRTAVDDGKEDGGPRLRRRRRELGQLRSAPWGRRRRSLRSPRLGGAPSAPAGDRAVLSLARPVRRLRTPRILPRGLAAPLQEDGGSPGPAAVGSPLGPRRTERPSGERTPPSVSAPGRRDPGRCSPCRCLT